MRYYRFLSVVALMCFANQMLRAQPDSLSLTLEQCIRLAQEQSPSVQSAKHSFLSEHWNYRYFCANYLPSVTLSASPSINNSVSQITQGDGTSKFLRQSQINASANLRINQNISLTGGTFFVNSSLSFNRELERKTTGFSSTPISVGYSQSLFGYNSLKWDKKIKPLRYTQAQKNYAEQLELISANTTRYFFNLVNAQSSLDLARSNYASADTLYRMAQGRYKIGTITENEMLQLEIRRLSAEASAMDTEISLEEQLQSFRSFLGLNQETNIRLIPSDSVPEFEIPLDKALNLALQNSPDPMSYKIQRLQAQSSLASAKANAGLKADIYMQFGLSQTGSTLAEVYGKPMHQEYGSITFSLPILDWGRGKGSVKVARSQQELIELQVQQGMEDFRQNVQKVVVQFNMQAKKVRIAKLTHKRAEDRYKVAMHLYVSGQSSLLDLNDAIAERNSAQSSYLYAISTYWSLYYTIRSMTGYDFLNDCELVHNLPV